MSFYNVLPLNYRTALILYTCNCALYFYLPGIENPSFEGNVDQEVEQVDETQGEGDSTEPEGIYTNVRSDINLARTQVKVADLEDYTMKKKADMTYFNNEYKVQEALQVTCYMSRIILLVSFHLLASKTKHSLLQGHLYYRNNRIPDIVVCRISNEIQQAVIINKP